MKKTILSVAVILFMALVLVSCSNGASNVAKSWLTAFYHGDYEAAKKLSTEETKGMLTQFAQFSSMIPDSVKQQNKKIVINVKDVKETGDKAVVTYSTSDQAAKTEQISMVKQNGKWLVQFSKDNAMGGAEDKPENNDPNKPATPNEGGMGDDSTKH